MTWRDGQLEAEEKAIAMWRPRARRLLLALVLAVGVRRSRSVKALEAKNKRTEFLPVVLGHLS